ncbi:heavy metal translocating P-type ATPase [Alteribacter populi]|uniref:heavy metal translocating P-type ATPase n=1 Tax=Alteribacter populi TaxID=2011011 RepID=UPI0012FDFC0F|nr:heavy metal translocating P-type ATPase [Alteribacter populi]
MSNHEEFQVRGFTCASCATQFERNVNKLPGVSEAKVNFTASKLSVDGTVTVEELERAGAFENLKIQEASFSNNDWESDPIWKQGKNIRVAIASLFALAGWIALFQLGGESLLSVSLFLGAITIGGYQLFWQGLKNLVRAQFDMKTLMTIAIIGAAFIGEWGEAAVVVVLFAISEALESYSMDKARRSLRNLIDLTPKNTTVLQGTKETSVSVSDVNVDDVLLIKPGEKIPVDGTVMEGHSSVSEASITGESIPVNKKEEDRVFAGTVNEEGILKVRVTNRVEDTTLAKIIHLVEEAQQEKAPAQQFVDRFAKFYTPAIMILAALVATVPPLFMGAIWSEWIYLGLATLVVGCPCALVISTPVAIVTAIGHSAKQGVLIKGGIYMEQAGKVNAIAFDKTGTLTKGVPEVTDVDPLDGEDKVRLLLTAYHLEKYANHPLAKAIVQYIKDLPEHVDSEIEVTDFVTLTGHGVRGKINSVESFAASPTFVKDHYPAMFTKSLMEKVESLQKEGKTVVVVGDAKEITGLIALRDEVKPRTKQTLTELTRLGVKKIVMLTGDNTYTANAIGTEAGVTEVRSRLLPADKLNVIKDMQQAGYSVGMVGDGMNDAPALAVADTSIAMGKVGTDAALETADISLMGDDLAKVPYTIRLSRKTMMIIKQNIVFSLVLKALALLLVPFGWLTLWIAIFADIGATLLVTLNSLRLIRTESGTKKPNNRKG